MNLVVHTSLMGECKDTARLEYLNSELECPVWMIGNDVAFRWQVERAKLIKKLKDMEGI